MVKKAKAYTQGVITRKKKIKYKIVKSQQAKMGIIAVKRKRKFYPECLRNLKNTCFRISHR